MSSIASGQTSIPVQAGLPGFGIVLEPPAAVGPLLRLPVVRALPDPLRRFAVLLMGRDRFVGELAADVPLLFFLLLWSTLRRANGRTRGPHRERVLDEGCRLARMPRRVLLEELNMAPRPAVLAFLRRCGYAGLQNQFAFRVVGAGSWWWNEWMAQWRVPHVHVLQEVETRFWEPVALALDALILSERGIRHEDGSRITPDSLRGRPLPQVYLRALRLLARMAGEIERTRFTPFERKRWLKRLSRCDSVRNLSGLCRQLREEIAEVARREDERLDTPFPVEHLPGTLAIVPITTPRMLDEEGRLMHHCIADYGEDALHGDFLAYRVLDPERATLSLVRAASGEWELDQLCCFANRRPRPETRAAVEKWLLSVRPTA